MARTLLAAFVWVSLGSPQPQPVAVTIDNYARAESDMNFAAMVNMGGFGTFAHSREPAPIEKQTIIRPNRDTLYSLAVFDLDASPVIVMLPPAGTRFMTMQLIDEDHYTPAVYYASGRYTLTRDQIGTRYVCVIIRMLVDPADPADLKAVHALQDAITVSQTNRGTFAIPNWDPVGLKKVRDALLTLAQTVSDTKRTFGPRDQVDPVRHLIGTAMGWGGSPEKDALYLPLRPARNDGQTIYRLTVPANVPVDGFWSISVYNAEGFFQKNDLNAYSLNNITAKKAADGSVTVQFGGCDPPSPVGSGGASARVPNCLPITKGWNSTVRLYRPRAEILNGTWKFPEAQAVP